MARWGKLFSSKGKSRDCSSQQCPESKTEWFLPGFDKSQIRLLLFLDHELRGRPLLLDSQTVRKIEPRLLQVPEAAPKAKGFARLCRKPPPVPTSSPSAAPESKTNGSPDLPKYQFNSHHSSPDVHLLGEMVFGTAALSYKGPSLKVHTLKCPQQLLISTVFIPSCRASRGPNTVSDGECPTVDPLLGPASLAEVTVPRDIASTGAAAQQKPEIAHSLPMDVPKSSGARACQARDHDSGFSNSSLTSSGSWQQVSFPPSPAGSSCSVNSTSCNSLQRRWRRSLQCSLDYGVPKPPPRYNYDDMSSSSVEPVPSRLRHAKVGMGVLFKEYGDEAAQRMQEFFFSHVTLVEGRMNKLRLVVEAARIGKANWQVAVMEAFEEFQQEIYDLYTAPRLPNPVWLDMMALALHRRMLCDAFMKELSGLIDKYDTKQTNFFLSTLLTATLTYHLSWVPTVIPAGVTTSRTYYSDKHTAKWLDLLTRSHPYNPLWAQLSDLCGAIGSPLRLARTVVIGKKAEVVRRFLYMLSYFIRCTEIHENAEEYTEQDCAVVVSSGCAASVQSAAPSGGGGGDGATSDVYSFGSLTWTTDNGTAACCSSTQPSGGDGVSLKRSSSGAAATPVADCCRRRSVASSDSVAAAASVIAGSGGGTNLGASFGAAAAIGMPVTGSSAANKVAQWISSCSETCDVPGRRDSAAAATTVQDGVGAAAGGISRCCVLADSGGGPLAAKKECVRALGREAPSSCVLQPLVQGIKQAIKQDDPAAAPSKQQQPPPSSRDQLRRLFSQELDEFDEYFDRPGEHNSFGRLVSPSTGSGGGSCVTSPAALTAPPGCSIFDEYFEEGVPIGLLSLQAQQQQHLLQAAAGGGSPGAACSAPCCHLQQCGSCTFAPPPLPSQADVDGGGRTGRHLLLKVPKPSGFLNWSEQQQPLPLSGPPPMCSECRQQQQQSANDCCFGGCGSVCDESATCGARQQQQPLRSATPDVAASVGSGLGPTRHASGGSAAPVEINETFCKYVDVPMPRSRSTRSCSRTGADVMTSTPMQTAANFGRSQLAGYSDHYLSDFVLHGTSDMQFERKLQSDLDLAVHFPILDEPVTEAVCIIANTDSWLVQVASSMKTTEEKKPIMTAPLVVNMVESVQSLYKQKMSSEFCMMHLEDTLREMYFKSRMLAEYVNSQKKVNMDDLSAMLGFDISDLPLLLSVAATHSTLLTDGLY